MFDVIIIGGGPAGLTAAIYASRSGLRTLLLEKQFVGGQASLTAAIENYPAVKIMSGFELCDNMREQAEQFGAEIRYEEVESLSLKEKIKTVKMQSGVTYEAKAVILCMGASARRLGLADEERFIGAGLSTCATCDGAFFKGKEVAVVGGGNTAVEDALYLSKLAAKVYIIHRRNQFRADEIMVRLLRTAPNVEIITPATVEKIKGGARVSGITALHDGQERDLDVAALFVAVGQNPVTGLVADILKLDEGGYIVTDEEMATDTGGVFAAGDIRRKPLRQVVTASADGAIAASSVAKYLLNNG